MHHLQREKQTKKTMKSMNIIHVYTGSPSLFCVVSLALRLLIYQRSSSRLWSALADNLSSRPTEVILWYLMLARPLSGIGCSRLWVPLLGTVSHLNYALFHGICPVRFTSSLKPLFSPGPWLGTPLSSYLEMALYKFHRQIPQKLRYINSPVAGCTALASIPTAYLLQDRILGVAVLVWLDALLFARDLPPSLLMCRPSYTPVLCSW